MPIEKDYTSQKMKCFIKDLFSKFDKIRSFLRIWSHLLKKSLAEILILRVVLALDKLMLQITDEDHLHNFSLLFYLINAYKDRLAVVAAVAALV